MFRRPDFNTFSVHWHLIVWSCLSCLSCLVTFTLLFWVPKVLQEHRDFSRHSKFEERNHSDPRDIESITMKNNRVQILRVLDQQQNCWIQSNVWFCMRQLFSGCHCSELGSHPSVDSVLTTALFITCLKQSQLHNTFSLVSSVLINRQVKLDSSHQHNGSQIKSAPLTQKME